MADQVDQKDVAGRFLQAMRTVTHSVTAKVFPDLNADAIMDIATERVEEEGLQQEPRDLILEWFQSDDDARWLEAFRQSPQGLRFLELSAELMMRAMVRELQAATEKAYQAGLEAAAKGGTDLIGV
jgi:hypothetical protein